MIFFLKKHNQSSTSIRKILLLMMCGLTTATILVFVALMVAMNLLPSLNDASYRSMSSQAEAQASSVGSELSSITRGAWRAATELTAQMEQLLEEERIDFAQLNAREEVLEQYLSGTYQELTQLLKEQSVSGAFVILDTEYRMNQQSGQVALYLRNSLPVDSTSTSSSITLLRGPSRLPELQNLALDKCWAYGHSLEDPGSSQFYNRPLEAARMYTKASARDLGYWSARFQMSPSDIEIITYTLPLVGEKGEIYGICGIELSLTNITRITPSGDLPYEDGFYLLGHFTDGSFVSETAIANDLLGEAFLEEAKDAIEVRPVSEATGYNIIRFHTPQGKNMLAAVVEVNVYTRNSPFANESYRLFVVAPQDQILMQANQVKRDVLIMLAVSAALSIAGAFFLSKYFASRVERLAIEAGKLNPEKRFELPRTRIYELDLLSDALERMNAEVAAHAARMSTIVDSVGMSMGAFEILVAEDTVFLTDSLFRVLGIPHDLDDSQYLPGDTFRRYLPQVNEKLNERDTFDFKWTSPSGEEEKWLRLKRTSGEEYIYGTVLDITDEVKQKERLEYERNYDPLTKLLNRNAYAEMMTCLIQKMPEKMGVFLFGDLDNLKNVNDTFGHDAGDRYIQMAADALSLFTREGGVVARISGDEFAVYLHGGNSREQLRKKVDELLVQIRKRQMVMPDGNIQKVRISVGLAYYPNDAKEISDLIQYADFAMYEIKHSSKGGTHEFNRESYDRNSYILKKPGQLDYLLDQHRTKLAFQPIIEVKTGRVYGYEVLMRPQTREIHSPDQVISLARSQAKLPQLEKLTILSLMDWIQNNDEEIGNYMLFYNSLPSQLLDESDYAKIQKGDSHV